MDINILRAAVTVFSLLVFLCIVVWAYSSRNKASLEEQGLLPLGDDGVWDPQTRRFASGPPSGGKSLGAARRLILEGGRNE